LNADLIEAAKLFATVEHKDLSARLHEKSKDNLISILTDLLAQYFNDSNSSTLRELVIVLACGFTLNTEKLGYNGYRQSGIGEKHEWCEAKPKNIRTAGAKASKLNGAGNFTDYTWERFERDKANNPMMIVGGFIDGRLFYIFSFKFNHERFVDRLAEQLTRQFPNGDVSGQYLRSASFGFKQYKDAPDLAVQIFVDGKTLDNHKQFLSRDIYARLSDLTND